MSLSWFGEQQSNTIHSAMVGDFKIPLIKKFNFILYRGFFFFPTVNGPFIKTDFIPATKETSINSKKFESLKLPFCDPNAKNNMEQHIVQWNFLRWRKCSLRAVPSVVAVVAAALEELTFKFLFNFNESKCKHVANNDCIGEGKSRKLEQKLK